MTMTMTMTMTSADVLDISIFRDIFISNSAPRANKRPKETTTSIYEPLMAFGFDCFLREEAI